MGHENLAKNGVRLETPVCKCKVCGVMFENEVSLESHSYEHLTPIRRRKCKHCWKRFLGAAELRKHVLMHPSERPYKCSVCKRRFFLKKRLMVHRRVHLGETPYKCIVCRAGFNRRFKLKAHFNKHEKTAPYLCRVCQKNFSCISELKRHKKKHSDLKPFLCGLCNQSFFKIANLNKHVLSAHCGRKPLRCKVCKKRFKSAKKLKSHQLTHTHPSVHKCKICKESLNGASNLEEHMLLHYKVTSFVCQICEETFAEFSGLYEHLRSHGNINCKCDICDENFNHSRALRNHLRIHIVDDAYKCHLCEKENFKSATDLQRHLKSHPSEKPRKINKKRKYSKAGGKKALQAEMKKPPHIEVGKVVRVYTRKTKNQASHAQNASALKTDGKSPSVIMPEKPDPVMNICTETNDNRLKRDVCEGKKESSKLHNLDIGNNIFQYDNDKSEQEMEELDCKICGEECDSLQALAMHLVWHSKESRKLEFDNMHGTPDLLSLAYRQLFFCAVCDRRFYFQSNLDIHFATQHMNDDNKL